MIPCEELLFYCGCNRKGAVRRFEGSGRYKIAIELIFEKALGYQDNLNLRYITSGAGVGFTPRGKFDTLVRSKQIEDRKGQRFFRLVQMKRKS